MHENKATWADKGLFVFVREAGLLDSESHSVLKQEAKEKVMEKDAVTLFHLGLEMDL